MSTTTKSPEQLNEEAAGIENRRQELEEQRAKLRDRAIAAERSGQSPDAILEEIRGVENRLEILTGTLAQIQEELPEAKRQSAAAAVAEIVAGAEGIRAEAQPVADAAAEAVRNLVATSRELEQMGTRYRNEVSRSRGLAKSAGVEEPRMGDDLMAAVLPASPDRWGLAHYWSTLVAPTLGELEQFATALRGAEHFNASREDTNE